MSRKKNIPKQASTDFVGRVGTLELQYQKQDHRTVLSRSYCTTPWHLLPPIYLDETGTAYTLLVNPSGGLVGGDHLFIDMRVEMGAHVLVSAPSANRVYRSRGDTSVQEVKIALGADAVLEWLPEHTIPFRGSRYRQTVDITLASGATILFWDALTSGRIARGERWAFASLENEIRLTTASGRQLLERYMLDPATDLGRVGLAEEWDYVASLYIVNDTFPSELWNRLEARLSLILDERPGQVLGGVSTPAVPGVAVKLLTRTAPDLACVLDSLWAATRDELWSLPPVNWRKY